MKVRKEKRLDVKALTSQKGESYLNTRVPADQTAKSWKATNKINKKNKIIKMGMYTRTILLLESASVAHYSNLPPTIIS